MNGIHEVGGSIPPGSTKPLKLVMQKVFNPKNDAYWLAALLLAMFLLGLDSAPYFADGEARYIQNAWAMVQNSDWLVPTFNSENFIDKPPLSFWLTALSIQTFGSDVFFARLPHALMMTALCLMIFAFGKKFYGRHTALLASLIMASCAMGFIASQVVMTDLAFSLSLSATLFAFLYAHLTASKLKRELFLMLMFVSAALAMLAKGLIGIFFPAMIIGSWIALTWQWRLVLRSRLILGTLLFVAITAPWHILIGQRLDEFYQYYFVNQHFERFLTDRHNRDKFFGFFLLVLGIGLLPWTMFFIQALKEKWQNIRDKKEIKNIDLYLVLWFALPLAFFSLSSSKLPLYILPIFPPAALIIGSYLSNIWQRQATKEFYIGVYGVAGFLILLSTAFIVLFFTGNVSPIMAQVFSPDFYTSIQFILTALISLALSLGLLFLLQQKGSPQKIIISLTGAAIIIIPSLYWLIAPKIFAAEGNQTFARAILPRISPKDEIASYNISYNDLPLYFNRPITLIYDKEKKTQPWVEAQDKFYTRWINAQHKIYVFIPRDKIEKFCKTFCASAEVVSENRLKIVMVNSPRKKR